MNNNLSNYSYNTLRNLILSYAELTEQEWKLISSKLSCKCLKKNEALISIGEVCDKVWFISKGLIRYYQYDVYQNDRTTCFAMENNFSTPFSSYLKSKPSHEVLVALEETEIIEITKSDFSTFIDTMPSMNSMYRQVLEEAFLQMENLNYILQHHTALERYQKLILEDSPELLQRVPLIYLASYLGISPETLSRVRAKI